MKGGNDNEGVNCPLPLGAGELDAFSAPRAIGSSVDLLTHEREGNVTLQKSETVSQVNRNNTVGGRGAYAGERSFCAWADASTSGTLTGGLDNDEDPCSESEACCAAPFSATA